MWPFNKKTEEQIQDEETGWNEDKEKFNNLVDFMTQQYSKVVVYRNDGLHRFRNSPMAAEDYVREVCMDIGRLSDMYRYVADHHNELKREAAKWKKMALENERRADQNQAKIDELTNYIADMQGKYNMVNKLMGDNDDRNE